MSLQTKTTLAVLVVTLACLAAFAGFTLAQIRAALVQSTVHRLEAVADSRVSQIEGLVASYRREASLVASRTRLRTLLARSGVQPDPVEQAQMTRILDDAVNADPAIESATVVDAAGRLVASTEPELTARGTRLAPDHAALTLERRKVTTIRALVDHDSQAPYVVAVVPMWLEGEHIGTTEVRFTPDALDRAIQTAGFGQSGKVVLGLRNREGAPRLLTPYGGKSDHSADHPLLGEHDSLVNRALRGESAALVEDVRDLNGRPVVAVTRHLPSLGWGLVVSFDAEEMTAPITTIRNALLMLGLALAALATGAGRILGGRLADAGARLEAELEFRRQAEQRFSQVVASAPNAMLLVTPRGRIELANRQAEKLLGYDADTLCSMAVEALVPESIRSQHAALRREFAEAPAARAMGANRDLYALRRDGHHVPVEIGLTPLETDEGPMVLAALVDLTGRKEAERALEERAEALERSNRELDEFAYVASHDLKAPLRAIDQLAGFIKEDAEAVLPEESRADLALLRQRVRRMESLLEGLLQYSRIGRKEGEPEQVDLGAVVAEVAELYVPAHRFRLETPSGPAASVYAPRAAVELVFRNLLMNAVKHHDREEGLIRIEWQVGAGEVLVTVTDDGPGIPAVYKEKVFQLFQTLKARDQVEGSGMGLALVKKTIETHGGTVELWPAEGRGATFAMRWPQRKADAKRAA